MADESGTPACSTTRTPLSTSTASTADGLPTIIRPQSVGPPSGGTMTPSPASFAQLLDSALTEPGIVSKAYSAFHGYSLGNQLLALMQCTQRGITPGPIST